MCLIIKLPAGESVPEHVVESALAYNGDGYGIMQHNTDGFPTMRKYTQTTVGQVMADLHSTREIERVIHFRMATHGDVTRSNAHPFRLADGSLLMHNGILSAYTVGANKTMSDTRRFIETFLNPKIKTNALDIAADVIEAEIVGNALAVIGPNAQTRLYGHSRWSEHYGCSFSNEYAWNAPKVNIKQFSSVKKPHTYAEFDDGETWAGYADALDYAEDDRTRIGGLMLAEVYAVCDSIDFTDYSLYAASDSLLCEQYIAGALTEFDLLDVVNADTLIGMYTQAVRNGAL